MFPSYFDELDLLSRSTFNFLPLTSKSLFVYSNLNGRISSGELLSGEPSNSLDFLLIACGGAFSRCGVFCFAISALLLSSRPFLLFLGGSLWQQQGRRTRPQRLDLEQLQRLLSLPSSNMIGEFCASTTTTPTWMRNPSPPSRGCLALEPSALTGGERVATLTSLT